MRSPSKWGIEATAATSAPLSFNQGLEQKIHVFIS